MSVHVTHYSDLLCVWAYVGEARLAELVTRFGADVEVEARFCSVFGDSARKIDRGWSSRGGYAGFAAHVQEVAARFDLTVHADLWLTTRPASSDSAHLFVKAAQLVEARGELGPGSSDALASALRRAFFRDSRDIARWEVQVEVAAEVGLELGPIEVEVRSGAAFAELSEDSRGQHESGVKGSPTLLLNEGRQKLYGNVGYRVIEANIQELLREPGAGQASWC
jgi:predicted DsbA family dithiol-disulfide isomerase